ALGQDDTLERKLTGQPAKPSPETTARALESSPCRRLSLASPQQQGEGRGGESNHPQAEAAADDSVFVIDVDRRNAESNNPGTAPTASDVHKDGRRRDGDGLPGLKRRVSRILLSPNIVAVVIGLIIAMITPLQKLLFDNPRAILRPLGAAVETVGTPTVAVSTLVMAGSLVQVPTMAMSVSSSTERSQNDAAPRWRRFQVLMGFLHGVCRLVVAPAVGFAVFWVARNRSSIMGENRLMHLILLIELAMPSAAFVIVSLNQLRLPATAGFVARLYLWHYGASMLTITAWTALAVHLVY
ncbi:unnamed protein product, partial [Hapterophycus canaliculatus]